MSTRSTKKLADATVAPPWVALAFAGLNSNSSRMLNRAASSPDREASVVVFRDGSIPTAAPHHLPGLFFAKDILALSRKRTLAYMRGYGLDCDNDNISTLEAQMKLKQHLMING
ncbi:hypothetical protein RQP46_001507 [Phenoliferia psychrophenolica]